VQVDLATLDLAFISVLKVIPAVARVLRPAPAPAQLLVLIKPQFEAGRGQVSHK
jgi:23S rRNA (cytidine1920-2'-O)/16S rRNA (cytidine1409-2'-O)-methyltransferase